MSLLTRWLASPAPDAAIEIAPGRIAAAAVAVRAGGAVVQAYAVEPLPPGALAVSLTAPNIADRDAVVGALQRVVERLGTRPARVALVLPDPVARVSILRFDQVPGRREELDQLVRWQLKKAAPFPIDEACVSYSPASRGAGGATELVVVAARRSIVSEYETLCAAAGLYAGLIDIATLSVVNLLLAGTAAPAGDWMVVYMRPEYTSLVILRGSDVLFFRSRPEDEEDTLSDIVHQTVMYYEDRLSGRGFARVFLGGAGNTPSALELTRHQLQERIDSPIESIDPAGATGLADRMTAGGESDALSPLVGILLRTREELTV